jgi:GntP family gluconate:H+ symporter
MYLLAPLFKAVARQTKRDYLLLVMCTVAGGTITHSLVPPTPGPLFVAGELGVPLGTMIAVGCLIGLGAALSGVLFARWANAHHQLEVPPDTTQETQDGIVPKQPPLLIALIPVVLPLLLIGLDASLSEGLAKSGSPLAPWVATLGDKDMALTLGAVSALLPLFFGWGRGNSNAAVATAVNNGAAILLIIGAGGAFGGVLQQTGIAADIAHRFEGFHALALPLVFLVTMLVRTAQGSATVAMITAAPIAKAFLTAGSAINPVYFAVAIGCGSKPFPWMNDAGFWIISKTSGLPEARALRTITPMMALQGFAGLLLTMLCAWLLPLK